ncbi:MAG: L-lactate permease [Anaerolineae bacterium]|nr:L-lactate permease [Anaerolineae bacterium]
MTRTIIVVAAASLLTLLFLLAPNSTPVEYVAAALPIVTVLALMTAFRWGGQRAGPVAWLIGLLAAAASFGLTFEVFWVSQAKGLLLSVFVMMVLWPALLLYYIVDQAGGIKAIARALEALINDRGLLLIVVAWAFSGTVEGLAGFGLPVAIVAPMLVSLGVSPVIAVAAVAVGHAWSVTFGDMGVVFQTLTGLVNVDEAKLASNAAILLGMACLVTGLAAARILDRGKTHWWKVVILGVLMGTIQYALAVSGLVPLSAFGAGLAGIAGGVLLSRFSGRAVRRVDGDPAGNPALTVQGEFAPPRFEITPPLAGALLSYGSLAVLMSAIALIGPLNDALKEIAWKASFPEVTTSDGFLTGAGTGTIIRPLVHPGTSILLIAVLSYVIYQRRALCLPCDWRAAAAATSRSAMPASIGIVSMVGLSTLMDHTGMTQLLAEGLSDVLDTFFPVVSPLVGMLGAFATGSNNNSNVLFASLQDQVAILIGAAPTLLLAAQTTGGALGSMIAPAKIIVGCSTVGLQGRDGEVMRITLPYGLLIGLGIGILALVCCQ